ncbi:hypothetical protein [Undibacterium parvum]|uniref:Uncharacterized protein n=2 Tax=Undibacterium TaxID=401469 RepID=A0A6M4A2U1_9BURK|nr:hypothetical protein [Undibacterium parvum]AZP10927.1 hypothetical protein EJN92_02175 [Undibacterium parvum]QJQ05504.1 hypothetical protein EJG51_006170 [Undibacterium piscinae]
MSGTLLCTIATRAKTVVTARFLVKNDQNSQPITRPNHGHLAIKILSDTTYWRFISRKKTLRDKTRQNATKRDKTRQNATKRDKTRQNATKYHANRKLTLFSVYFLKLID